MPKVIVADDVAAVEASSVVSVIKAGDDDSPRLSLILLTGSVSYLWPSVDVRDTFYKKLVEGMQKAAG